jgi:hypothetical protein
MKKYILMLFFFHLFLGCCKDEDPCSFEKEVNANFKAYTVANYAEWMRKYLKEKDWYYQNANMGAEFVLDSTIKWDSLEWHIGRDVIYNQARVFRNSFPDNIDIPITLIVKRKPNLICFPNDDGIDTLTKYYKFLKEDKDYKKRFIGKYKGVFIDYPPLKDSFEFEVFDSVMLDKYTVRSKNGVMSIKRLPISVCDYQIEMGLANPNELFWLLPGREWCIEEGKPQIASLYFSFINNYTNEIEILFNPDNNYSNREFPKITLKGYKIQ